MVDKASLSSLPKVRQPISKRFIIAESGEVLISYWCELGRHLHKKVWLKQDYWTCVGCYMEKPILQQKYVGEINNYYQLNSIVFDTSFNWN